LAKIPKNRRKFLKKVLSQKDLKLYSPLLFNKLKRRTAVKALIGEILKSEDRSYYEVGLNDNITSLGSLAAFSSRSLLTITSNKLTLKSLLATPTIKKQSVMNSLTVGLNTRWYLNLDLNTNIIPHPSFTKVLNKKVLNSFTNKAFNENLIP
jgi:hypothetical protein